MTRHPLEELADDLMLPVRVVAWVLVWLWRRWFA